jgi:hypothetical protein
VSQKQTEHFINATLERSLNIARNISAKRAKIDESLIVDVPAIKFDESRSSPFEELSSWKIRELDRMKLLAKRGIGHPVKVRDHRRIRTCEYRINRV